MYLSFENEAANSFVIFNWVWPGELTLPETIRWDSGQFAFHLKMMTSKQPGLQTLFTIQRGTGRIAYNIR